MSATTPPAASAQPDAKVCLCVSDLGPELSRIACPVHRDKQPTPPPAREAGAGRRVILLRQLQDCVVPYLERTNCHAMAGNVRRAIAALQAGEARGSQDADALGAQVARLFFSKSKGQEVAPIREHQLAAVCASAIELDRLYAPPAPAAEVDSAPSNELREAAKRIAAHLRARAEDFRVGFSELETDEAQEQAAQMDDDATLLDEWAGKGETT